MKSHSILLFDSELSESPLGPIVFLLSGNSPSEAVPLVAFSKTGHPVVVGRVDSFVCSPKTMYGKITFLPDRESQSFEKLWDANASHSSSTQNTISETYNILGNGKQIGILASKWELKSVSIQF